MRQLVYTMFISKNRALLHFWWKEHLVKHQRVSKYYENDCRVIYDSRKYWNILSCDRKGKILLNRSNMLHIDSNVLVAVEVCWENRKRCMNVYMCKLSLRKIPWFHLVFWYGNVVKRHSFRRVSAHCILNSCLNIFLSVKLFF